MASALSGLPAAQGLTLDHLSRYFHMPINDVAKELGICATVLKKVCRRNGIPRWPHRKIKSLDKHIANLEIALTAYPDDELKTQQEIAALKEKRSHLLRNPGLLSAKPRLSKGTKKHPARSSSKSSDSEDSDSPLSANGSPLADGYSSPDQLAPPSPLAKRRPHPEPLLPLDAPAPALPKFTVLEQSLRQPYYIPYPAPAMQQQLLPSAYPRFTPLVLPPLRDPQMWHCHSFVNVPAQRIAPGLAELSRAAEEIRQTCV